MLWFALFGFLGYLTYRLYRDHRYRGIRQQVAQYKGRHYRDLPRHEKRTLRALVDQALNFGITLDEETNQVVDMVFKESEMADLYDQDEIVGLHEIHGQK